MTYFVDKPLLLNLACDHHLDLIKCCHKAEEIGTLQWEIQTFSPFDFSEHSKRDVSHFARIKDDTSDMPL